MVDDQTLARCGERYVLVEAWMGDGSGRVVPTSRVERELMESARREGRANASEQVVVPTP